MAKTRPNHPKRKSKKSTSDRTVSKPSKHPLPPKLLLAQAAQSVQLGQLEVALAKANEALGLFEIGTAESVPVLNLLGEIQIELGDIFSARKYFQQAATIDKDGEMGEDDGGGAEKFLWLAQLSEEGGHDSLHWFEKGAFILRRQIQELLDGKLKNTEDKISFEEKSKQLAGALCSQVEVFMTDLSWEKDAEKRCESLITEATMVAPGFAEPWQTLANIRISQQRLEDARAALRRSLDIWKDLPSQDPNVPEYPTRVSLARLLMEADMDTDAIEVLERLVAEDDSSVEVWYLGGWCHYIMGEKQRNEAKTKNSNSEDWEGLWISSRQWLKHALNLFEQQSYEDERIGEHAKELLARLNLELEEEVAADEENEKDWSDFEESGDEIMINN